jgi:micrococcal nuclease
MALRRAWFVIGAGVFCLLLTACAATEAATTLPPTRGPSTLATATTSTPPPDPRPSTTATPATFSTTTISRTATTAGEDGRGAVAEVVDGDTIVVCLFGGLLGATGSGEGEHVRLIGIDAPETGEDFSKQATDALKKLVEGQEVELVFDEEIRDQYGRVLAYLFLEDGSMVNAELLRQGVATLYTVPPNVRFVDALQKAQDEAQAAGAGIWGATAPSPLSVLKVNYNPPGDDTLDLNEEYIVFQVLVSGSLKGYAVEDETGHRFDFSDHIFRKSESITLRSGKGTNTGTDLYWGATDAAIWNNDGDTVKLLDPQGHIVESYAY